MNAALVLMMVGTVAVAHDCEKPCIPGRCSYKDCTDPSCPGGVCDFTNCLRPSCEGGACVFQRCHDPTCEGGGCTFTDTMTTLRDGYCPGGSCIVQGKRWPAKIAGRVSM